MEKNITLQNKLFNMDTKAKNKENVFQKILEDKKAIRACIRNHGDIKKVVDERKIKFATPL